MNPILFRQTNSLLLMACSLAVSAAHCSAQDLITTIDDRTGMVSQFQGQVMSWDSEKLAYVTSGKDREMPSSRVSRIDYPKSIEQQQADLYFASAQFDQASLACEQAIVKETRTWVIEEIRALKLQCAAATGNVGQSVVEFFEILKQSPRTRFLHLMPLAWHTSQRAGGALVLEFRNWLEQDDPVRGLIAASWLLISDTEQATKRLRDLQISGDTQIRATGGSPALARGTDHCRRSGTSAMASVDRSNARVESGWSPIPCCCGKKAYRARREFGDRLVANSDFVSGTIPGFRRGIRRSTLIAGIAGSRRRRGDCCRELQQNFGFSAAALRSKNTMEQFGK